MQKHQIFPWTVLTNINTIEKSAQSLFCEITVLVNKARSNVVSVANYELVFLNWNIGKRIKTEIIRVRDPTMVNKLLLF